MVCRIYRSAFVSSLAVILAAAGCSVDNHTQEGTLLGGLFGAGAGALIGHAVGGSAATGALMAQGRVRSAVRHSAPAKIRLRPRTAQQSSSRSAANWPGLRTSRTCWP